jgi:hypothetical protein
MSNPIPINIAVEDVLSDAVARRLIQNSSLHYAIGRSYFKNGSGYLKNKISGFNAAALHTPFLIITDLDDFECPNALINAWLNVPRSSGLLFRIAVKEIETWIIADREHLSRYFGVSINLLPRDTESIEDPKRFLVQLANRSKYSALKRDLSPISPAYNIIGPNYNSRMIEFTNTKWDPSRARNNSESLDRAMRCIDAFTFDY